MSDLEVIHIDGILRRMGRTEPDSSALKMRAGITSFTDYMMSKGIDIAKTFARSTWKPVKRRGLLAQDIDIDQLQFGACVGASDIISFMCERMLAGMSFVKLSWGYVYDQINGGQDNGACITDSMDVQRLKGAPTFDEYPAPVFNTRSQPASCARFKLAEAFTLSTFDEICIALQLGGIPQYPVQVGRNYGNFTGDGVCGVSRGPGNHSVCALGLIQLTNGEWVLEHRGSWGALWGPWKDGWGYHSEAAVSGCSAGDDAYVKFAASIDPQNAPPLVAG